MNVLTFVRNYLQICVLLKAARQNKMNSSFLFQPTSKHSTRYSQKYLTTTQIPSNASFTFVQSFVDLSFLVSKFRFIFGNFGYRPSKSRRYMYIGFAFIPLGVSRAFCHLQRTHLSRRRQIV